MYLIAVSRFDKEISRKVVWLLEDGSDASCVLYLPDHYFVVSEILSLYDSGSLRGGLLSTQIGKASLHHLIFLVQMVCYRTELGAIMQTAWYNAVPF